MGQTKGTTKCRGNKEENDKFYTKPDVAKFCISKIEDLATFDIIVEPSAGDGSFYKNLGNRCIAYDIAPEQEDIIKQDYLKLDTWIFFEKKVLTIGNPPFGSQNNMAIKFFNKAAEYSDTIAFILPKSFMKESVQSRLDKNFILVECINIEPDSFLLNGENYSVGCVFQIWKKSNTPRCVSKKSYENQYIDFVKKEDGYDFIIRRVGGNCGKAFIVDGDVSIQSNYFIRNKSEYSNQDLINMINSINMTCRDYCVGPRSISKAEL